MKINGRDVDAKEVLTSPMLRQGIQQMCILDKVWTEFDLKGFTIDEEEIEKQMNDARSNALASGATFEQYLKDMRTTEEDYRQNLRIRFAFDKLIDDQLDLSEENLRKTFEENSDRYLDIHMRENNLTDSERSELTFEDVSETVRDMYKRDNQGRAQSVLLQELTDAATLELTLLTEADDRSFYEDIILNGFKTDHEWPVKSVNPIDMSKGDTEEQPVDEATGDDPAEADEAMNDGEAEADPVPEKEEPAGH